MTVRGTAMENGQSDLPVYAAHEAPTQHNYQLDSTKGDAWLTLSMNSQAKTTKHLPLFHNGDVIGGSVELDFSTTSGIQGVSIAVTAGVTAVGQEEDRFLHISQTLWDSKTAASSKPSGKQSWSFSLPLPTEINLPSKGKASRTLSLPPSFSERASPAYIEYKTTVTIHRGFFKANKTLATPLIYLPHLRAELPSSLRQAAYHDGTPLIGPEGDPDGWKVSAPVTIKGTLFNTRDVEIHITLAIAKPLSFARGSPIPLFLTVSGNDEQAVDLLSTPSAVKLHLLRSRILGPYATDNESSIPSDKIFREVVGSAYFWPMEQDDRGKAPRTLQGELNVGAALKPSFIFSGFTLRYDLILLPPQATGFSSKMSAKEQLLKETISIVSAEATGNVPRSYAPPGYVESEDTDYNNSLGFLENGNQRFLHHGGQGGI